MIKINQLEIENVKRIKAVKIKPSKEGLTIVGGRNNQGKTSVLDAIAWALGGDKYRPSQVARDGAMVPPNLHIVLSNGIVVERRGVNSALKVIDPDGKKGGQQLLNSFVEQLALDLPRFMESSDKEKANTLLKIIGVEEQLKYFDSEEQRLYQERLTIGRVADQKEKFAKEQPYHPDVPHDLISPKELIAQQQEILARNGENQRKRNERERWDRELAQAQIAFDQAKEQLRKAEEAAMAARKSAENIEDESTAQLEANLANIEEINVKIRANLDKEKAEDDAKGYREEYDKLTGLITEVRDKRTALLESADLPLRGLSVTEGKLTYNGYPWDNLSGSDQLRVATAIVRKLNPDCGFVLMDKLEQMDLDTLSEFGTWLEDQGLQAIATRVSTGDECSVIIEDGYVAGEEIGAPAVEETAPKWKAGEF
ncbi:AAA family ATPase [Eubacterium sp.]|uniref:AAA family ATPase n=1 Tax=Eubacterium sp. TaxID=142586 RepID=UPI002FC73E88